ncbi:hypothetical protein PInf_023163 [Phytophthora infestans]|nr:hypothetical protein PInf_023163 [Phytophthora infestans]
MDEMEFWLKVATFWLLDMPSVTLAALHGYIVLFAVRLVFRRRWPGATTSASSGVLTAVFVAFWASLVALVTLVAVCRAEGDKMGLVVPQWMTFGYTAVIWMTLGLLTIKYSRADALNFDSWQVVTLHYFGWEIANIVIVLYMLHHTPIAVHCLSDTRSAEKSREDTITPSAPAMDDVEIQIEFQVPSVRGREKDDCQFLENANVPLLNEEIEPLANGTIAYVNAISIAKDEESALHHNESI